MTILLKDRPNICSALLRNTDLTACNIKKGTFLLAELMEGVYRHAPRDKYFCWLQSKPLHTEMQDGCVLSNIPSKAINSSVYSSHFPKKKTCHIPWTHHGNSGNVEHFFSSCKNYTVSALCFQNKGSEGGETRSFNFKPSPDSQSAQGSTQNSCKVSTTLIIN